MPKVPENVGIGNTTFRRPWRIPIGLRVLEELIQAYPFNKKTSDNFEKDLNEKLIKNGVVESEKPSAWNGRKFLANCIQFGFIAIRPDKKKDQYKLNNKNLDEKIVEIIKKYPEIKMNTKPYSLTPLGKMLKNTDSDGKELTAEQKDIFLKSMFYHKQPSPAQKYSSSYDGETFYPLKLYIDIIIELKKKKMEPHITPSEMAVIVNDYKTNSIENIISEIIDFRSRFKKQKGFERILAKRWFENKKRNVQYETATAYMDTNFAAAISTGLFTKKGKKLIFVEEKKHICELISNHQYPYENEDDLEYLKNLWLGDLLPFEDKNLLKNEAKNIIKKLEKEHKIKPSIVINKVTSNDELKKAYYRSKDQYSILQEIDYYKDQKNRANEILKLLNDIQSSKQEILIDNEILKAEPHHLEWIVWRIFLAINNIHNEIKSTRNFPVDDNFIASHHAKSGVEDMFFEFENYVLNVEPSFKTGRSQIKDESEPVFFHCAKKIWNFLISLFIPYLLEIKKLKLNYLIISVRATMTKKII